MSELTRRTALAAAALAGGGVLLRGVRVAAQGQAEAAPGHSGQRTIAPDELPGLPPGAPGLDYTPVVVPDGRTLPWRLVGGVKVYHLVAEEVDHEFAPGLRAWCWGYNGVVHGPMIEAVEGDRVRIYVTNRLPAATTVHWHAAIVPSGMDGVGGISQRAIHPGETFKYEFTLRQHGTLMYHSHHDEMTQIGMGMTGLFVVHPRRPRERRPERDYALLLHEWHIPAGARRPNPNEMTDFNVLTINAKAFPATTPMVALRGERVRIRLGNLSPMDHHPMHLHGHAFFVTETDGGVIPAGARWPEATVLVPVGATRTIELVADNPGDWALHCHMTHHMMNQMGHEFPNMIGVDPAGLDERVRRLLPGYMTMGERGMAEADMSHMQVPANSIPMLGARGPKDRVTMGGMVTLLKVREALEPGQDPGWYADPPGTVAAPATAEDLARDGIEVTAPPPPTPPRPHDH
ncbi:MAG: copper oxidase [Planctomycetes bacterium]|nr:copper oxidase [Planctomycetota bacterium]